MSRERLIQSIQQCIAAAESDFQAYKAEQFDVMIKDPENANLLGTVSEVREFQKFFNSAKQLLHGISEVKTTPPPEVVEEEVVQETQEAETKGPELPEEAGEIAKQHNIREFLIGTIGSRAPIGIQDLHKFTSKSGFNQAEVLVALTELIEEEAVDNAAEVLSLTATGKTEWETILESVSF